MLNIVNEHLSRRAFMKGTLVTGSGLIVPNWGALAHAQSPAATAKKKHKRCILLWMNGGASQIDTFDMKPGRPTGGPFRPMASKIPGMMMCEYLPKMAEQAKHLAVIRSLRTQSPDHPDGIYHMHTCYKMSERVPHPELGAVIAKYAGPEDSDLPNFVRMGPTGNGGSGYLGPKYEPFSISREGNLPPFSGGNSSQDAEARRAEMFRFVEGEFGKDHQADPFESHRLAKERAWRLQKAKKVFDITKEWETAKERYGNTQFGRGCFMALKLAEAGIPFVEVGQDNYDSHSDNFVVHKANMQVLDPAWAALLGDLSERGLLDDTLVVWLGEVGRTPTINNRAGRDHFIRAWTVVLSGAGIKGGQVYGESDLDGKEVKSNPVTEGDLFATIYRSLGIDHRKKHYQGPRPIWLTPENSKPVEGLI